MKLPRLISLGVLVLCSVTAAGAGEWIDLFNGRDLTGWTQRGGKAPFVVEQGAIIGTTARGEPNSFLCTAESHADFVLELEFWVDPLLNSGVQFRGLAAAEEIAATAADGTPLRNAKGEALRIPAGRVHSYQCEIDVDAPRGRWWVGGVYDEARRGWLFPGSAGGDAAAFTAAGAATHVAGTWNHLRIEAAGPRLRTWVNGHLRAELHDTVTTAGFIALQVHSVSDQPEFRDLKARFRAIRLRPLDAAEVAAAQAPLPAAADNQLTAAERSAGWRLLWDGHSSAGWRSARSPSFPDRGWEMKDGLLTVLETGGREADAGGDIITVEKFPAFELTLEARLIPGANSGIKYFVDPALNQGPGSSIGLEFQLLDDVRHPDALLGRDGNRTLGSLYDLIPAPATKPARPPGEWNTARIVCTGTHVEHWLNGVKLFAFERGSPEFRALVAQSKYTVWPGFGELPTGHILLQDHGNQVHFRNVKLRPLTPR